MIATVNGIDLYFEVHGSGEPLLLLHGFSGSSQNWASLVPEWQQQFQLIIPDLRGHGRSGTLTKPFRHSDAADDIIALLDRLDVERVSGIGISGGANVLLHLATRQPDRVRSLVLVSATPYFPAQARPIMRAFADNVPEAQWKIWRETHPGGDPQIHALLASTKAFAGSYDDLAFTPPHLATINARTLIVQGDRDPFYPVRLSVEMAEAIPDSSLWIVPNAGHGPVFGDRWQEFLKAAREHLS